MNAILSVQNATKRFGSFTAVDGVSFDIPTGKIVGLLGPNGAGKTTIISMILGVLHPDEGSITIDNIQTTTNRSKVHNQTNFSALYAQLPGNLTVWENLRFFSLLYDIPNRKKKIAALLNDLGILHLKDEKYGVLSSGEQTKVNLAKALLNDPRLLLLDEPTASLDPSVAREVQLQILRRAKDNKSAVLWASHNMFEVERVCDRVLFLSRGKILLEGDPKTLPQKYQKKNLEDLFIAVAHEPLIVKETL